MKSDNKIYLVDEKTLKHLLARDRELEYLESVGVDNWSYYGECRTEFIKEDLEILLKKPISEDEDLEFEDIAEELLKDFTEYRN